MQQNLFKGGTYPWWPPTLVLPHSVVNICDLIHGNLALFSDLPKKRKWFSSVSGISCRTAVWNCTAKNVNIIVAFSSSYVAQISEGSLYVYVAWFTKAMDKLCKGRDSRE